MAIVTEKDKKTYSMIITAASFAVTFMLLVILCIGRHITPFGDNTFLYLDMKRQYVDFYSYYKSVFTGNNDFLYSFSGALGQSMPGFTAYYLTSPLLIPLIFVSRTQLPTAVTFLCIVKISLSGLTSNIYIREHNQQPCSFASVIFSTSFAMSAYMAANMCNIMWLDPIIMLPVILIGIDSIIAHKPPFIYILSLASALFTNYYIAYMIIIFTLLYTLCGLFIHERGQIPCGRKKAAAVYFFGSMAGCALPAFILLPAFMELRSSTKNAVKMGLNVTLCNLNPFKVLTKLLSLTFDYGQVMSGMPHIFCGIFILMLVILFYMDRSIPAYRKIRYAVMQGIMMISFSAAGIDIIWHAGTEPMGYQYRYAFLFVFIMVSCAYESFSALRMRADVQSGDAAGRGIRRFRYAEAAAAFAAAAGITVYAAYGQLTFFSRIKMIYNLAMIAAVSVLIVLWADGRRKQLRKAALTFLVLLQAGDLMLNVYLIWSTESKQQMPVSVFRSFSAGTEAALDTLDENGTTMYRVEDCTPRSENDGMQYGYNGITHYDSMNRMATLSLLHRLGYESNTIYSNYEIGNTHLANDLLGIRYVLSDEEQGITGMRFKPDNIGGRPTDTVHVYTMAMALPMAVAFNADADADIDTADPFTMQSAFINELCGHDTGILRQADVSVTADSGIKVRHNGSSETLTLNDGTDNVGNKVHCTVTPAISGNIYFYMTVPGNDTQNIELIYNGGSLGSYANDSDWAVINLGTHRAGQTLSFDMVLHDRVTEIGKVLFASEDEAALAAAHDSLKPGFAAVHKISSSHIRIDVPDAGSSLYLSVPYDPAWHASAGGRRLQIKSFGGLTAVSVDGAGNGPCVVDMRYIPKGLAAGIIISIMAAAALILTGLVRRK